MFGTDAYRRRACIGKSRFRPHETLDGNENNMPGAEKVRDFSQAKLDWWLMQPTAH